MTGTGPAAPRGPLPEGAERYRSIGPFDAETLPRGLRAMHHLKSGTWAVVELAKGSLRFAWDDGLGGTEDLLAPASIVVPPQVIHHVEGGGPFELKIAFYR